MHICDFYFLFVYLYFLIFLQCIYIVSQATVFFKSSQFVCLCACECDRYFESYRKESQNHHLFPQRMKRKHTQGIGEYVLLMQGTQ